MQVLPTLDDLPSSGRNCATCTHEGGSCPRSNRQQFPNGYVHNSATREIGGMIAGCMHYTGKR